MGMLIAVSGKGGVGKTTLAALLVRRLVALGRKPVLAIDADPNMCLDELLGVRIVSTVGGIREEARAIASQGMATGVSKQELLEYKIAESLVETEDFDLIAMGRSEGAGCYCFANNVLKNAITHLSAKYPYLVLDNEAGFENLSRRIVQSVDLLIMVSDPSMRGLRTVERLHEMTGEMAIRYRRLALAVNRVHGSGASRAVYDLGEQLGASGVYAFPENSELAAIAEEGRDVGGISPENPVIREIDRLLGDLVAENPA